MLVPIRFLKYIQHFEIYFCVICKNIYKSIFSNNRPTGINIYHCTSGTTNPIYWRDIERLGHEFILQNPFSDILWYPGGSFKSNRFVNYLCVAAFQAAPAYVIDGLAKISGRQPR